MTCTETTHTSEIYR